MYPSLKEFHFADCFTVSFYIDCLCLIYFDHFAFSKHIAILWFYIILCCICYSLSLNREIFALPGRRWPISGQSERQKLLVFHVSNCIHSSPLISESTRSNSNRILNRMHEECIEYTYLNFHTAWRLAYRHWPQQSEMRILRDWKQLRSSGDKWHVSNPMCQMSKNSPYIAGITYAMRLLDPCRCIRVPGGSPWRSRFQGGFEGEEWQHEAYGGRMTDADSVQTWGTTSITEHHVLTPQELK